jgi:hypothetical protein
MPPLIGRRRATAGPKSAPNADALYAQLTPRRRQIADDAKAQGFLIQPSPDVLLERWWLARCQSRAWPDVRTTGARRMAWLAGISVDMTPADREMPPGVIVALESLLSPRVVVLPVVRSFTPRLCGLAVGPTSATAWPVSRPDAAPLAAAILKLLGLDCGPAPGSIIPLTSVSDPVPLRRSA